MPVMAAAADDFSLFDEEAVVAGLTLEPIVSAGGE